MRNKNVRVISHAALIAALYAVLSYMQNVLFPGSANAAIQFRVSECLNVLALFTPAAIPGLAVGCLVFNLNYAGALPLDPVVGTAATVLAAGAMYLSRRVCIKKYPFLAMWMPALFNGLLVGWELWFYIGGGFWYNAACVAIGEAAVMLTLGTVLYYTFRLRKLDKRLFL